jgi:glycerol-3-phosphate dehydrogenase subunit B
MNANGCDVLVIGEGLSGLTAAASAASHGAHVTLVSKGAGNFALGSGCVDLEDVDQRTLGLEEIDESEAVNFFLDLTASAQCAYSGGIGERTVVPTILGTFQRTSLAPRTLWQADPRNYKQVVVAGIADLPGFDPNFLAERLSFHAGQLALDTLYRSAMVALPHSPRHPLTALEIATHIDRDSAFRTAVVHALRPVIEHADLLILPGILGVKSDDADLVCFEEEVGCAICELATLPPAVPSLRLLNRLELHLAQMGVEIFTGFPVGKLRTEGEQCVAVELETPGRPRRLRADCVVLACGRFAPFLEPPPADFTGSTSSLSNVFACGSLLGQFAPRQRNAISILTGYRAGMLASRQGVQYAGR